MNPSEWGTEEGGGKISQIIDNETNFTYLTDSMAECGLLGDSTKDKMLINLIDGLIRPDVIRKCVNSTCENRNNSIEVGSNPICCPEGSLPAKPATSDMKSKISEFFIDDLPVYLTGLESMRDGRAIICIYDIYGFKGGRIREICDEIADDGYLVILPDVFRGEAYSDDRNPADKESWIKHQSDPIRVRRDLEDRVIPWLKVFICFKFN